jgi:hypothetical protein
MSCPDENTFASLQAGLLSPREMAEFHLHLDRCQACLELAGMLGCLDDTKSVRTANAGQDGPYPPPSLADAPRLTTQSRRPARECVVALGAATLAHAYFSVAMTPIFWRAAKTAGGNVVFTNLFGGFSPVATLYIELWGAVGFVWACVAWLALVTGRRWARMAAASYAVLSLPTIVLAPLGICTLVTLRIRTVQFHALSSGPGPLV